LLDADKKPNSPLVEAVKQSETLNEAGGIQSSSCVRLMYEWCSRIKQKISEIEEAKVKKISELEEAKVKKQKVSELEEAKVKPKDKPTAKATKEVLKRPPSKSVVVQSPGNRINPYAALSTSAKEFLSRLGITTAEEFLSTRTTDIANAFVTWREDHKMPVLKGLGAIASVSGWKAQVRKAATSVGLDQVAAIAPNTNSVSVQQPKTTPLDRKQKPITFERPAIKDTTDRDVLFGKPRRRFSVRGGGKQSKKLSCVSFSDWSHSLHSTVLRRRHLALSF
jgi:hypothetical protein